MVKNSEIIFIPRIIQSTITLLTKSQANIIASYLINERIYPIITETIESDIR